MQYPVDVTKDLLLICNVNSTSSTALRDYYLAHRPLVANANVLNIVCDVGEFTTTNNCEAQIVTPVLNWLAANPTKHPQYVVLFFDIPTRFYTYPSFDYGSVSFHLQNSIPGLKPFVTYLNGGTVADCKAYVDKLAYVGTNYSPNKVIISARSGGYGNTNYYFDDAQRAYPFTPGEEAKNSVIQNGISSANVFYVNGDTHITNATNVAAYMTWGANGHQNKDYAINGDVVFRGESTWYVILTIESFNGVRVDPGQGTFIKWFSSNAFGGTNYSNTPVGAVTHVEEPGYYGVNDRATYFGLWVQNRNFAVCAWKSIRTPYFQAVGDPLVQR